MSSNSMRRRQVGRKTVVIGFDFGTHSTKVVFRERGKRDGFIALFDEEAEGYPFLSSPSLVRCSGDCLFFGTEALLTSGGQLFRSLKVNLLPGQQRASFRFPDGFDSRCLVAAYFTWAFQQLRQSLSEYSEANVFINLAAPMSHFEIRKLKVKYLQIVQAAWKLSFSDNATPIHQGISVSKAKGILVPLIRQPVVGPEQRRFEVLPETIAPVVSLSLDPLMRPGMYMIVDTGAATTEISVFHAGDADADQKVLCYQDETMLVGGNDLLLAEHHGGAKGLDEIRRITEFLEKRYRRVWQLGYQFDAPNRWARKRWKELTLVLSGGGTRHQAVAERLGAANPMCAWPETDTHFDVGRHLPGTLERQCEMDDDDLSMFAVANGLAIERMNWPVVFQPDEIERMPPTEDLDDKPQGYWYLGD